MLESMSPAPAECAEKTELLATLKSAIDTLLDLNNRQLEAAIAGRLHELELLESELRGARNRKCDLINTYRNHVQEHGC